VGIKEDLAAAKERVADRVKTPEIPVVVGGKTHVLVFFRAEPLEWSTVTLKHPPREGIALDRQNGYDIAGVSRAVSVSLGRFVEDGTEVELSAEEWADFWDVVPPATGRLIEANVWALHEHDDEQEVGAAKKGSTPRSSSRPKQS